MFPDFANRVPQVCSAIILAAARLSAAPPPVEFNRDIRPIFSDRCYTCHGPSSTTRKSALRFDQESIAKSDLGGRFAIVPGDPAKSELIQRVSTDDKARRMPPVWSGAAKLSAHEIDLLTRWIQQGAEWQKLWSFIPPKRPDLPQVSNPAWPKNPIDSFVLARLDHEGLKPSPEADRATLLRRVSLDLTGLPPTPAEVAAFENDTSKGAYEKVVDRLLASPHYGERMAVPWLDAARYADTNGYQTDAERFMWRWRDWVIDAFNRNMRFDEFTIDQLAGDLLPNPTRQQIIATGFNRNHRINGEGGIIPEEYAAEYVVDRVDTTSTVWLGITLGCARCHDHKYDPLKQKEFYQFFAYFNNVPERGMGFKYGNSPPFVAAPTDEQSAKLLALDHKLASAKNELAKAAPEIEQAQTAWERASAKSAPDWTNPHALAVHLPLDGDLRGELHRDPPLSKKLRYKLTTGPLESDDESEPLKPTWDDGSAHYGPGLNANVRAAEFDGKRYIEVGDIANFSFYDSFTLSAWIYPESGTGAIVTRAKDIEQEAGIGLYLKDGHVQANMVLRWLDDGGRVETKGKVELNRWTHVAVTYDGTRLASGIRIYINGQPAEVNVPLDTINQNFAAKQPLRIGAGLGPGNRFHGRIAGVNVYRRAIPSDEVAVLAVPEPVARLAQMAPEHRSAAQANKLRWSFLDRYAPEAQRQLRLRTLDLTDERKKFFDSIPTVMVMQEMPKPRETHVLLRGAYDHPGDKVEPGVPAVLPPLPHGAPNNRLGLAKWLVDPSNPLTARVTVNRFWQMYFGMGIVKTTEDFGSQGAWPSNPELLDWLATEFIRTGWDVKAMQKTIVMSATYRQSSKATPELEQRDPENRLLARGPRVRLSAETLRDEALAASGLLVDKIGGPSVKPYQPPGLWKELTGGEEYEPDTGEGLHRRSLYTFWKRTAPPPMMMNFDAAGRETCVVSEVKTNTPLQALDLMNDAVFLEAARALAAQMLTEGGAQPAARIAYGFRLAAAREPKPRESEILLRSLGYYRDLFVTDPAAARKYLQGADEKLDRAELAAYATVASLILNMDAVVTKD